MLLQNIWWVRTDGSWPENVHVIRVSVVVTIMPILEYIFVLNQTKTYYCVCVCVREARVAWLHD